MTRDEFTELVYETFADEPDNVLANGIIEAADAYVEHEKAQLSEGTTSDTISRQVAIDRFNVIRPVDAKKDEYTKGIDVGIAMCIVAVKDQPTVQTERAEGEWINTNPEYKNGFYNNSYYCSKCHDYYTTSPYEMKFCPNCGAKMKGETT